MATVLRVRRPGPREATRYEKGENLASKNPEAPGFTSVVALVPFLLTHAG